MSERAVHCAALPNLESGNVAGRCRGSTDHWLHQARWLVWVRFARYTTVTTVIVHKYMGPGDSIDRKRQAVVGVYGG